MTEKQISNKITKALKKAGYIVNALPKPPGWADISAFKNGKVYFLEVKRPNKPLSPLQQLLQQKFQQNHFIYERVTSLEDVKKLGLL